MLVLLAVILLAIVSLAAAVSESESVMGIQTIVMIILVASSPVLYLLS